MAVKGLGKREALARRAESASRRRREMDMEANLVHRRKDFQYRKIRVLWSFCFV
jgi:hypothetical protein